MKAMKDFDVVVWIILIIGGLNWGLVGLFDFNLVAAIFGPMSLITRFIYIIVGVAAIYDVLAVKAIWRRWEMHFENQPHVETPSHAL